MGFMDKFLDVMRLNDDEEDEYEFDNDEYEEEEERKPLFRAREKSARERTTAPQTIQRQQPQQAVRREAAAPQRERAAAKPAKPAGKITPIRRSLGKQVPEEMEVCIIKPTSVADEQEITETLLEGRAVVINMEGLDMEIAQRIMDFTAGSTFAMRGHLQKIANYVFIATPSSVDVSGDIQSLVGAMGLSSDL